LEPQQQQQRAQLCRIKWLAKSGHNATDFWVKKNQATMQDPEITGR